MNPAPSHFAERFGGVALVTGASSGIGEAFVRALAARGMDVVVVARRGDRLQALAEELGARDSVRLHPVVQDLSAPDAVSTLVREIEQRGLQIGLLINNAGVGAYGPFSAQTPEQTAAMIDLNCRVPAELSRRLLPPMLERGRGGIVFVASMAGFQPTPWFATYGATKAFAVMFAEALAVELQGRGIDVLALAPGYTPTEFQAVAGSGETRHTGQITTPLEVVTAALDAIGTRTVVVPGWRNRLAALASSMLPRRTVARLAGRMMAPESKSTGAPP